MYRKGQGGPYVHALPWCTAREAAPRLQHGQPQALTRVITVSQGVLVGGVLCHGSCGGSHSVQIGYMVAQFLDGLHLLIQLMSLDGVTQVGIILVSGHFVQFQ